MAAHPQYREELGHLVNIAAECHSVLEIGSKNGYTLNELARAMPVGSRVVSVDWPGKNWGTVNSKAKLENIIRELSGEGYDAHLFLGDSHDKAIVDDVARLAPFDLVFIDADHNYEAVRGDWLNYGPMGKAVAFHDIASVGMPTAEGLMDVRRLWGELKTQHVHKEFICDRQPPMGIGVLWR